jgi:hypothetical protein
MTVVPESRPGVTVGIENNREIEFRGADEWVFREGALFVQKRAADGSVSAIAVFTAGAWRYVRRADSL